MQFTQVKIDWYTSTFIFYLVIILLCYFIAIVGKKVVFVFGRSSKPIKQSWLILVSLILIFVKGFGTTGRDIRGGYFLNFLSATSLEEFRDHSTEIGYQTLNIVVRIFTDKYWIFILICTLITILPVVHLLKKYTNQIDTPTAVLLYVTCYFFNCFSPMRQAMSASIILYGFDAMIEHRHGKAFFLIMIASLFHSTALIFMLPLFFSHIKLMSKKFISFYLLMMFLIIYFSRNSMLSMFAANNSRYFVYNAIQSVRFGFQQIVYYAPLFLIFYFGQKLDTDEQFARLSFAFLLIGFFCGMLSYVIPAFGRFDISFTPFIIIVPRYFMLIKRRFPRNKLILNLAVITYCIARFVIFISDYYNSQDLMPYTNIFGWVI